MDNELQKLNEEVSKIFNQPNAMRSLIILAVSIVLAFYLSKIVAWAIVKLAQFIATISDNTPHAERQIRLRRIETYLSVSIALVRAVIVGFVAFYVWQLLSPSASTTAAVFGSTAFFVVLAGGTIGIVLKDITAGASMIIEGWFHVGDYIDVEPYDNLSGVVEKLTLRSTKLRSLNGEVIWVHNQNMQAVRITPNGLRTIAVDIFVNDDKAGKRLIEKVIETIPTGTMKVAKKPEITREEEWGTNVWLFTIVGETPPGREWLMENYFVESLKEVDERSSKPAVMIRPPIVRYADPDAERSFKRAVNMAQK